MQWRSVRNVLLLVALGAAAARACAQAPSYPPTARVSAPSVARVVARAEVPSPRPDAAAFHDDLALVPRANDLGTPSAWRQWTVRGASREAASYVGATSDDAGIVVAGASGSRATLSDRLTACGA